MAKSPKQLDRDIAESLAKRTRGHATRSQHMFTYRNKHGAYSNVWATDAEDAKQQIRTRGDAPGTFFTISRVTNVPPRTVDHARKRASHASKARALKKPAVSAEAVAFFKKHAGAAKSPGESWAKARTRGARQLAEAEAEAEVRGWTVDWDEDPEEWMGDTERPFEVLNAVLRDAEGNVLSSLGGIGMSGNRKQDRDYGRVIEAELALEAL